MITAGWIFDHVGNDLETILVEEHAVFAFIQTSMIERLAFISSDCFPMRRPAGEHEGCIQFSMLSENRKHSALIFRTQVEEAVPRQNTIKTPIQRQHSHVRDDPILIRETGLAHANEG